MTKISFLQFQSCETPKNTFFFPLTPDLKFAEKEKYEVIFQFYFFPCHLLEPFSKICKPHYQIQKRVA